MRDARPDPMDLACELVKSTHAERDLVLFKLALELCDVLSTGAYHPARFPARPYVLEDKTFAQVEASLPNAEFALALGGYRAQVTELEALSAQRLIVLCSTVRTLFKLSDRTTDPSTLERIEGMLARLASHLALAWRIEPPGQTIDLRTWTVQVTRRYDLLPRAWRYL
jgi:hypothetical protein